MRSLLVGACAALVGCFTEAPALEPGPVEQCMACSSERCTADHDACLADVECAACIARPKSLECLANMLFRPVADCSCSGCADDCSYMCPGGQGACDSCTATACSTTADACLVDVECAPCLEDPFRDGCSENAMYMAQATCVCETCGQECIWLCPAAATTCVSCFNTPCNAEFGACLAEEACTDCFSNPSFEGCDTDASYGALTMCVCAACPDDCAVLYCA